MTEATRNVAVEVRVLEVGQSALRVTDGAVTAWICQEQIRPSSQITMDSPPHHQGTLVIPWWLADTEGLV